MHLPSGEVHKITKICTSPRPHYAPVRKYAVPVPNYALPRPIMHFPGREVHNLTKLCTRIGPVSGGPEKQREQATITALREYFTLGGCASPKMQIHRTSHNNSCEREYFTLGGCASPEMQIHRTSHNNSCEREYFTLGGCAGPERKLTYEQREQATITAVRENISLWEGGAGPGRPLYTSRESKPQ